MAPKPQMKLLILCSEGNNRSVTFAHLLKYWGNDCIAAGVNTNSPETLQMLAKWADKIIFTEKGQEIPYAVLWQNKDYSDKSVLFDVGPDTYPRPFNAELLAKAKSILEANKEWLKQ